MSEAAIKVCPPIIYLYVPYQWNESAQKIGLGIMFDGRKKCFKLGFGADELIAIKKQFPHAKIVDGQEHVDRLKEIRTNTLQSVVQGYKDVSLDTVHFKVPPFTHQKEGVKYLEAFNGGALFADCGSGKTAMTLWDIEHKIQVEDLHPSSTLIVGKLMTLHSGWNDDTLTFTSLNSKVLWEPSQSEVIKGEVVERISHGEKPAGKGKTFRKTEYRDLRGRVIILAKQSQFNPDRHVAYIREWKQVGDVKYGDETLAPITRRNVRAENIAHAIRSRSEHIHVINHDGLIKFEKELTERKYQMIVIDESTAIKNHKSKTFQALMNIAQYSQYRRILSGTPSPQGPQDLWSQFYFLDMGTTLGASYDHFINTYFNVIKLGGKDTDRFMGVKLSPKPGTIQKIQELLQARIFRCRLRDCIDLPPISIGVLDVYMDDKQRSHYNSMAEAFFSEIDGTRIEVTIDLAKIGKLRQITGGFILSKTGEVIKVSDSNPKLNTLLDYISEIPEDEKIVIFAVFRCEIELLLKTFGDQAVAIYGGETDVGKIDAQKRFKTDPKIRYIICQPQSASYGVNGLTIARYLIFYSIDFKADCNYQAIKRIERAGQVRNMFVRYLLAKKSIDEGIFKIVNKKDQVQKDTIDILETLRREHVDY